MIYVHVPFCRSFCTYCDFYSEIAGGTCGKEIEAYLASLLKEIEARKEEIKAPTGVDTLYIGGGTPSALPLTALERIVSALKDLRPGGFSEFTVEVNPDDITPAFASGLKALLGASRVSMGIQSFDNGLLRWMNRRHDAEGAVTAFRTLRDAGFGNISVDLIFGLPGLTSEIWKDTLKKTLELRPEHISAYQLSIEEGSALARMVERGECSEAPEEVCSEQYGLLCRELADAGFLHYEISNFALEGREAVHNSAYWRRVPYVGLGPGAHSLSRGGGREWRSWNSESVSRWRSEGEELTPEDIRTERIMLGLRTARGMDATELESLAGKEKTDMLREEGALAETGSGPGIAAVRLRIPEEKFFVSDDIIRELI